MNDDALFYLPLPVTPGMSLKDLDRSTLDDCNFFIYQNFEGVDVSFFYSKIPLFEKIFQIRQFLVAQDSVKKGNFGRLANAYM